MINKFFLYTLIISFSLTIGCHQRESKEEFEKSVLNQVFKELTDSLIYYQSFPPPPPPPLEDSSGKIIDTNIVIYHKLIAQIDTTRKVISITDSTMLDRNFKRWISLYEPYLDTLNFKFSINEITLSKPEKMMVDTA